jgi:hypothetical protein
MFEQASPGSHTRFASPLTECHQTARSFGSRRGLALVMFLVLPVAAQSPGMGPGYPGSQSGHIGQKQQQDSDSGLDVRIETKRIATLNLLRQKSMVSDAQRILRLAQELNDDANASTSALTPAERQRKAAEIEHLAKEVKEKMTYVVGVPAEERGPFSVTSR